MMKAEQRSVCWLFVVVVIVLAGSAAASALAAGQTFNDLSTQTPYSIAYRLPIHVVQAASPGWDVLLLVWVMLAAIAFAGHRLIGALCEIRRRSSTWLLSSFAVAALVLSAFAIVQSSDIYFYVLYGRLYGIYGINPYLLGGKLAVAADPLIAQLLPFTNDPPFSDPYGPLWTLVAGLQSRVTAGVPLWWAAWSFRAAAVAAGALCVCGLLYALRRRTPATRIRAAGAFAFHPLVLYETAVGGHNDALMLAPAVWAFAIVDELPLIAGLLLGAAIAVKYVAAIALPFLVVRARRGGAFACVLSAALAVAVPLLCAHPFQAGTAGSQALASNGSRFAMSLEWLVNVPIFAAGFGNVPALRGLPPLPLVGSVAWGRLPQLVLLALTGAIVVVGAVRALRAFDWKYVWRSVTALLLSLPSMHPWYGLWLAPAVACEGPWATYAWWFGIFVFGCYILDVIGGAGVALWTSIGATILYLVVPAVIAWAAGRARTAMPDPSPPA